MEVIEACSSLGIMTDGKTIFLRLLTSRVEEGSNVVCRTTINNQLIEA